MIGYSAAFGLLTALCVCAQDSRVTVSLSSESQVVGLNTTTVRGIPYYSFRGIPYAVPPVGQLRYKDPVPYTWNGSVEAVEDAPRCSQRSGGQEDCLYLNVYVPLGNDSSPLAVMFYIYGGKYARGSATNKPPDYFMDHGVLLVTFNYRVSSIGFLSLLNDDIPGNAGLKDQQMALQWVQRNIAAFQGDPASVSVGGESAGGCSVGDLITSPAAAGLFQQATIISGEAISPWGILPDPRQRAFALAEVLGFSTNDSQQLVDFLRTQDAGDLVRHDVDIIPPEEAIRLVAMPWAPVIDGNFIQEYPINKLRTGRYSKVPILVGYTSGEGTIGEQGKGYLTSEAALQELNEHFVEAAAPLVRLPTAEQREAAALRIREFYFGSGDITLAQAQAIIDLMTDFGFAEPSDTAVRIMANHSDAAPIFYHLFDYRGPSIGDSTYGTPHGSQRSMLFSGIVSNPDEEFIQLRTNMVRLWANFVKYGTPSPDGETIEWTAFNNADQNYMHITNTFEMKQNVLKERMDFWHEIIPV
uniref:Carboxylesterase n=1 Tax=Oxya chinensis TaxID=165482 RepID=A0A0C5KC14_9ORTH|nr:carboxylesterase [Oxya chinensis]